MTESQQTIQRAISAIRLPDERSRDAARALQAQLTKPAGALGRLEELHIWAAGVLREPAPSLGAKTIVVAAADHGVAAEGVSAYPQDVTAQMVRNFLAGGAAVNVLAAHAGADLRIVDAGVITDIDDSDLYVAKIGRGTRNITVGPGMTRDDAETLIVRGVELAREACADGARAIGLGDMGIGNTTAAAAIATVFTGVPPRVTAGRGTGIDDDAFETKVAAIERAIALNSPDPLDPVNVVAGIGGCEIALLAGVALGAASSGAIVVLDGYPTTAAALITCALAPLATEYMIASHLSAEPGHRLILDHLGLRPLLEFDMRLGEGTGAALAMSVLEGALRIPREMATFDDARISRSSLEVAPEA